MSRTAPRFTRCLVALVLVAGCAGTPGASPGASGTGPTATASQSGSGGPASVLPPPSDEPSPSSSTATPAAACEILPVEVVQTALGTDAVTAETTPGNADYSYCNYRTAGGTSVLGTSYTVTQTFVFDAYASNPDVVEVPGVRDRAIFTGGILMIRRGVSVFTLQPGTVDLTGDELLAALTAVAAAAAENLDPGGTAAGPPHRGAIMRAWTNQLVDS